MKRREFITLLGSAATWPLAARAQQAEMRRIGVIAGALEADPEVQARMAAFRQQLGKLGWVEGRNVRFEYRWAVGDGDRMRSGVAELIRLAPDAILSTGTPVTALLQQHTRTIPIVFTLVGDPIASALVTNLARPGANITGFTNRAGR